MAVAKKTSSKASGTRSKSAATKSGTGKRTSAKAAPPRDVAPATLEAALTLAATRSWADIALAEIAEEAGLKLSEIYPVFPTKGAILAAFSRRIDGLVLSEDLEGLEDSPARDRLFDVMMRRFDALEPYRDPVGNILADLWSDPVSALGGLPQLSRSMSWMLEAASVSTEGWRGLLRVQGLVGIYLATLRIWLRDDSADKSKTMAQLDAYLRRIETLSERFGRRGAAQEAA
ncbi:TetR family transcriptional regulator [Algihabitans albus]|uniref:TetR family transcriptional regulator n=1 Tax=Algihabitans albus TaxID=2164067 RepID=UPI000E5D0DC7|nr:TetR family transcriptional regulator [Algihabitans albus]